MPCIRPWLAFWLLLAVLVPLVSVGILEWEEIAGLPCKLHNKKELYNEN